MDLSTSLKDANNILHGQWNLENPLPSTSMTETQNLNYPSQYQNPSFYSVPRTPQPGSNNALAAFLYNYPHLRNNMYNQNPMFHHTPYFPPNTILPPTPLPPQATLVSQTPILSSVPDQSSLVPLTSQVPVTSVASMMPMSSTGRDNTILFDLKPPASKSDANESTADSVNPSISQDKQPSEGSPEINVIDNIDMDVVYEGSIEDSVEKKMEKMEKAIKHYREIINVFDKEIRRLKRTLEKKEVEHQRELKEVNDHHWQKRGEANNYIRLAQTKNTQLQNRLDSIQGEKNNVIDYLKRTITNLENL